MKNKIIAGGFVLLFATAVHAQSESAGKDEKAARHELKKEERELRRSGKIETYQTEQAFLRDFPDAQNVSWDMPSLFEEATFYKDGKTMTAYYDIDNELVGTTSEHAFNEIPKKAQDHISKFYKDYTAGAVILFDDNENNDTDMELYGTVFDDADNYFVTLKNEKQTIILKVDMEGDTSFFKKL